MEAPAHRSARSTGVMPISSGRSASASRVNAAEDEEQEEVVFGGRSAAASRDNAIAGASRRTKERPLGETKEEDNRGSESDDDSDADQGVPCSALDVRRVGSASPARKNEAEFEARDHDGLRLEDCSGPS